METDRTNCCRTSCCSATRANRTPATQTTTAAEAVKLTSSASSNLEETMTKFFIDDSIIIDAWLMVLHRNSEQDKRLLRMLNRDDIRVIHEIRRELAGLWATQRGKESSYKKMRDEYLDQQAKRDGWSQETRNLYASILSTIGNWSRAGGRDERAQAELIELWKGAGLILLFSDLPIQGQLQL